MVLIILLFWIYLLISSEPSACSAVAFPPLENSYYVAISVLIISVKLEGVPFHPIGFYDLVRNGMVFVII